MISILQLKFRRTTVIVCGLVAFLIGLVVARLKVPIQTWSVWLSLLAAAATFRLKNLVAVLCVIVCGLMLGLWRGGIYMHRLSTYLPLYQHKVTMVGQADNTGTYDKASQLAFDLVSIRVQSPQPATLVGKIGVKGYGENAVFRGDTVQVVGKLYSTHGSRQASLSYAQVKILRPSSSTINSLRRRFEAGMLSALPEPQASFGLGLLVGQTSTLPKEISGQLSVVGLTHIVAVSGYNLTIIISGVYLLLKKFSKYQATLMSIVLIFLFLLFTGMSASIVRAAFVSILSLWAAYYGREFRPLMLVLIAAALTAGWSPIYLWSDIGWYLSFLAFYGILILAPLILKRLYGGRSPKALPTILAETLAAQLMTIPIVMYIFGQISLVALPANILIVPLVPLAMVLAFAAALGGMLLPALAGWLAWPAQIVLTYMLDMVALMAKIPHALTTRSLKIEQLIAMYGLIVALCFLLWVKNRHRTGIITDKITEEL